MCSRLGRGADLRFARGLLDGDPVRGDLPGGDGRARALPPLLSIAGAGQIDEPTLFETRERWGTRELCDEILELVCPTLAASEEGRRWFANWLRVGVRAPTLVLYRDTRPPTPEESRGVAALIPQARAMRVSWSACGDRPVRSLYAQATPRHAGVASSSLARSGRFPRWDLLPRIARARSFRISPVASKGPSGDDDLSAR